MGQFLTERHNIKKYCISLILQILRQQEEETNFISTVGIGGRVDFKLFASLIASISSIRIVYLSKIAENNEMEVETDGTLEHAEIRTVVEMLDTLTIYGDFESQYLASLRREDSHNYL